MKKNNFFTWSDEKLWSRIWFLESTLLKEKSNKALLLLIEELGEEEIVSGLVIWESLADEEEEDEEGDDNSFSLLFHKNPKLLLFCEQVISCFIWSWWWSRSLLLWSWWWWWWSPTPNLENGMNILPSKFSIFFCCWKLLFKPNLSSSTTSSSCNPPLKEKTQNLKLHFKKNRE